MFSIRQNFFETNSSSVHALVIPKNTPIANITVVIIPNTYPTFAISSNSRPSFSNFL